MTDETYDFSGDDGRGDVQSEHQTAEPVQGAGFQLSSLPDPCSSTQFAAVLSKSPRTVVDWCQEREYTLLPCFKIGNRWYHRLPELKRWLNGLKSGQVKFRRKFRSKKRR